MTRPYGRTIRRKVGALLSGDDPDTALAALAEIPDEQLAGHLFFHFHHRDEVIKFRSAAAMGRLAARIARTNMEKARILVRRIMWNLNDESGGIGWGSPEAMGEILAHNPDLAQEYQSILFSYLDPDGNYLEHPMLQRGVLWGIGTFLGARPDALDPKTAHLLNGHLRSTDRFKRAYALRALSMAGVLENGSLPTDITLDTDPVEVFDGWQLVPTPPADLAQNDKSPASC